MAQTGSSEQTHLNPYWNSSRLCRPDNLRREVFGTFLGSSPQSWRSEPLRSARYRLMLEELFEEYERWYQIGCSAQYWDFDFPHPFRGPKELTDGQFSSLEQAFTQIGKEIIISASVEDILKLTKIESGHSCSADYHLGRRLPNELVEMIAAYIPHEETPEGKDTGSDRSNATLHSGDRSDFDYPNDTSDNDDATNEDGDAFDVSDTSSFKGSNPLFNEEIYMSDWMGEKFREDEDRWRTNAARLGGR